MTADEWVRAHTFECKRLKARITPAQCLENQKRAKKNLRSSWGSAGASWKTDRLAWHCLDCDEGKAVSESAMCPHCGKRPKAPGREDCGRVKCRAKTGRSKKMKAVAVKKVKDVCVCLECGAEFEPYKHGAVTMNSKCRECLLSQIGTTLNRKLKVKVDFAEYPELFDFLRKEAKKNFRTPNQQLLAVLADYAGKTGATAE